MTQPDEALQPALTPLEYKLELRKMLLRVPGVSERAVRNAWLLEDVKDLNGREQLAASSDIDLILHRLDSEKIKAFAGRAARHAKGVGVSTAIVELLKRSPKFGPSEPDRSVGKRSPVIRFTRGEASRGHDQRRRPAADLAADQPALHGPPGHRRLLSDRTVEILVFVGKGRRPRMLNYSGRVNAGPGRLLTIRDIRAMARDDNDEPMRIGSFFVWTAAVSACDEHGTLVEKRFTIVPLMQVVASAVFLLVAAALFVLGSSVAVNLSGRYHVEGAELDPAGPGVHVRRRSGTGGAERISCASSRPYAGPLRPRFSCGVGTCSLLATARCYTTPIASNHSSCGASMAASCGSSRMAGRWYRATRSNSPPSRARAVKRHLRCVPALRCSGTRPPRRGEVASAAWPLRQRIAADLGVAALSHGPFAPTFRDAKCPVLSDFRGDKCVRDVGPELSNVHAFAMTLKHGQRYGRLPAAPSGRTRPARGCAARRRAGSADRAPAVPWRYPAESGRGSAVGVRGVSLAEHGEPSDRLLRRARADPAPRCDRPDGAWFQVDRASILRPGGHGTQGDGADRAGCGAAPEALERALERDGGQRRDPRAAAAQHERARCIVLEPARSRQLCRQRRNEPRSISPTSCGATPGYPDELVVEHESGTLRIENPPAWPWTFVIVPLLGPGGKGYGATRVEGTVPRKSWFGEVPPMEQ